MNTSKKDEQQMLWYSEVENANANTSSKIKQTIWTKWNQASSLKMIIKVLGTPSSVLSHNTELWVSEIAFFPIWLPVPEDKYSSTII